MTACTHPVDALTQGHFALAEALSARLSPAAVVRADEPLARRTTLRVGDC